MHPWSENLRHWWRNRQPNASPDVRSVLKGESIHVVFQPIVDLHTAAVIGHEALMRESGSASKRPFDQLLTTAKDQRRQKQFEIACLESAIKRWSKEKPKGLLFVNISARTLVHLHLADGSDALLKLLEKHQMEPQRMGLDITGYSRLPNIDKLADTLRPLREEGVSIVLDNFKPTDCTMEVWAKVLPGMVKMAPHWTRDIEHCSEHQRVVSSLVRLTKNHAGLLLAKSVESESELRAMQQLGVDLAQGYFLGSPASELVRTLNLRASAAFSAMQKDAELT